VRQINTMVKSQQKTPRQKSVFYGICFYYFVLLTPVISNAPLSVYMFTNSSDMVSFCLTLFSLSIFNLFLALFGWYLSYFFTF